MRLITITLLLLVAQQAASQQQATDVAYAADMERLVLDDMEDVSDWYNGSTVETTISTDAAHVKQGKTSLKFANRVDHTKGEKNYPIGWPRTGKDLTRTGQSEWSAYDFFECWIYAETSRSSLPATPLSVGFYHSGPKRSTSFPLKEVRKDAWQHIVVPTERLQDAADVRRAQFNISESNYKHGDRVDFFIDDMVLTRFRHPVIGELRPTGRLLYTAEHLITTTYTLMGYRSDGPVQGVLDIGQGTASRPESVRATASQRGELQLSLRQPLSAGSYWVRLTLIDPQGNVLDRKQATFRVIEGPF